MTMLLRKSRRIADVQRDAAAVRLYCARRVSGRPVDMGWESQSVRLVPPDQLAMVMAAPKESSFLAVAQKLVMRSGR